MRIIPHRHIPHTSSAASSLNSANPSAQENAPAEPLHHTPCHPQCFVEFDGFLQAEKKAKATLQTEVSAVTTSWNNSSWHSIHFRHHLQIRSEQIWSWSLPTILEIFPQFHTCILSLLKQGRARTRFQYSWVCIPSRSSLDHHLSTDLLMLG